MLIDSRAKDGMGNVAVLTAPSRDPVRTIGEAEAFFAEERPPWILFALPDAVPSVDAAVRNRAFRDEGWFPGMLLDPIDAPSEPLPEGAEVRRVESLDQLREFERTASRAYAVEPGPVYPDWLTHPGFSFHLAYDRGRPVATATLVASHGLAGIVYVGTVPEARRRGFGRAVVRAAVGAGMALGMGAGALWATPGGHRLYLRMGFRQVTRYRIWTPTYCPLPPAFRSGE